jgi:hypothetical protein
MTLQVANTILAQLGGNKFLAMTGAKNLVGSDDTLSFRIPASNGINHVSVTLDCNDTYRVTFGKFAKLELRIVHTQGDVYADQLQTLFTDQTGLLTRL